MNRLFPISLVVVGGLILVLQIPIVLISGLRAERQGALYEASHDVARKWGGEQSIIGPVVIVPFVQRGAEKVNSGQIKEVSRIVSATFLPSRLSVVGNQVSQTRSRGIFEVPVYRLELDFDGSFEPPRFQEWGVDAADILWKQAYVSVQVADPKAIQEQVTLDWNGQRLDFEPNPGEFSQGSGIHVRFPGPLDQPARFRFRLAVNGSQGAFFAPVAARTQVQLDSDWPHPSFQGNWLPQTHSVADSGFRAEWDIPSLGSNYRKSWTSDSRLLPLTDFPTFGVNLISPINPYRMAQRSLKYELLFLFVPFLVMWMLEVMGRSRIHTIHYSLVGAAICLFYLLLLSLSEHISFGVAYALASLAVVALLTGYGRAILGGTAGGLTLGTVTSVLYAFLYVVLKNQDYALLMGSIGLLLLLAAVMFLTRHVDWYDSLGGGKPTA